MIGIWYDITDKKVTTKKPEGKCIFEGFISIEIYNYLKRIGKL